MASRSAKKQRFQNQTCKTAIQQNKALTVMDMHNAYTKGFEEGFEKGREEGFHQASTHTVKCLFGAVVVAAHSLYGFGQERCIRLLNGVYRTTLETLTTHEMAQRAFDEVGVEIDWEEPVEIAQPKETDRRKKENRL